MRAAFRVKNQEDKHKTTVYVRLGLFTELITGLKKQGSNFTEFINQKMSEQVLQWREDNLAEKQNGESAN